MSVTCQALRVSHCLVNMPGCQVVWIVHTCWNRVQLVVAKFEHCQVAPGFKPQWSFYSVVSRFLTLMALLDFLSLSRKLQQGRKEHLWESPHWSIKARASACQSHALDPAQLRSVSSHSKLCVFWWLCLYRVYPCRCCCLQHWSEIQVTQWNVRTHAHTRSHSHPHTHARTHAHIPWPWPWRTAARNWPRCPV